jgi:uncharacterized protein YndB with AHSA1/START domain
MKKNIKHTFFFPCPPARVWEFLVDSELLAQWLMPNDFKPVLGHEFSFRIKPMPQFNCDGNFHCKILEITPPKKLVYSWNAGPGDGTVNLATTVEWTLVEKDGGTELRLVHSGFDEKENMDIYMGMMNGWAQNVQKIEKLLNPVVDDGTSH